MLAIESISLFSGVFAVIEGKGMWLCLEKWSKFLKIRNHKDFVRSLNSPRSIYTRIPKIVGEGEKKSTPCIQQQRVQWPLKFSLLMAMWFFSLMKWGHISYKIMRGLNNIIESIFLSKFNHKWKYIYSQKSCNIKVCKKIKINQRFCSKGLANLFFTSLHLQNEKSALDLE